MFAELDGKDRKTVIEAMEEKRFNTGEVIIKEGDDGDNLYVVD
jgi:cAMP-dependent protein kinase regulator